jgi:hypothetical protein
MSTLLAAGLIWMSQVFSPAPPGPADDEQKKPVDSGLPTLAQDKAPAPPPEAAPPPAPAQDSLFKTLVKQVSLDGQIRLRGEFRNPISYANSPAATSSDDLFLTRIRISLDFKVSDDIDVFVQPQDQRQWGQEVSVLSDERNFDLHQGFVEIRHLLGEPLSVKGGRMELSYGDQRLVSPLDWSNVGRAWDGVKVRYAPKDWWIEGFYTMIKDVLPTAPAPFGGPPTGNVGGGHDEEFMGIYFSYVGVADHEFDLYGFFRDFRDNPVTGENGNNGSLVDRTFGARIKGALAGFDYTLEAMSQTGHYADDRILAYAYVGTLGYTFEVPWKPRLGVEYDFASGDRTLGDGRRNTFDPLFPFGHYYQGFADTFAFKNGKDAAVFLKVAPADYLSFHADFHNFWLSSDTDAWFNAAGNAIRPRVASGIDSTSVGHEIDLHARLAAGKYVKFWAGWCHFFAGSYVRETQTTGTSRDMNFAFLQMTVDF